jgi:hypothetical protein
MCHQPVQAGERLGIDWSSLAISGQIVQKIEGSLGFKHQSLMAIGSSVVTSVTRPKPTVAAAQNR